MTKEEYRVRFNNIEKDCKNRKQELMRLYCALNNPYHKGDILVSVYGDMIEVRKIIVCATFGNEIPECRYEGKRLRKDLTPYKNSDEITIHQHNVAKKIERNGIDE
jgi:hypothetical protein